MRHEWSPPDREQYRTTRVCRHCGMRKITRHDGWPPWTEWVDREARQIVMPDGKTPTCVQAKETADADA